MGVVQDVVGYLRQAFRNDKDRGAALLAKGSMSPSFPDSGYDLLQAYGYDALSDYLRLEHDLLSRYVDYEEMDDYPEISAAIDIYADDATQPDTQLRRTLWAVSGDRTVETLMDDLFYKRLRVDEDAWEIARTLVKYGQDYEEMLINDDGVVGLNFLPPPTVRRIEGQRGELYGFIQDFRGRFGYSPQEFQKLLASRTDAIRKMYQPGSKTASQSFDHVTGFEPWEVVHFRTRGKHRRSTYGYSVLEAARWIWKRLLLLEDAAMIYRLQRAPERFAFYVDVGDLPPPEALAYVNRVRQQHKKKKFVNPSTNKLDLKWEPLSQDDDFFVPTRKGVDGTRIEVLGSPSWQHMDDVEYFRSKMFAAIKVPKAYMNQDESEGRASLSSKDVRFARTVLRVQREIRNGFHKVGRVHLAALGLNPEAVDFDVQMTVPSAVFELAQVEVRNARADLATRMREHVSLHWVLSNVYNLSDDDIELVIKQRVEDSLRDGQVQAETEKMIAVAQAQAQGGGGGGGVFASAPAPKGLKLIERRLRNLPSNRRGGISEQELFSGDREAEKRAGDKLDRLQRSNDTQLKKLNEIGGLVRDVASSQRKVGSD